MTKKIHSVGINDSGEDKEFYLTWVHMLERCYSPKRLERQPSYIECSVAEEWHIFSNFQPWAKTQDSKGKTLDNDLLLPDNKLYSRETCVFISKTLNSFLAVDMPRTTELPRGVSISGKKFMARVRNPFTKKQEYLGTFSCPDEAHKAWKKRKQELACLLAELEHDEKIINALVTRYSC